MTTTLAQLNTCDAASFVSTLHGIYEHSPWIAQFCRMGETHRLSN